MDPQEEELFVKQYDQLTAADMNLGLAGQKAAVASLLLTTVQGRFSGGFCRW